MGNSSKLALITKLANEITMNMPFVYDDDSQRIDNIDNHYEGNDITVTIERDEGEYYYQITMTGLTEDYSDGLDVVDRLFELYTPIYYADRSK